MIRIDVAESCSGDGLPFAGIVIERDGVTASITFKASPGGDHCEHGDYAIVAEAETATEMDVFVKSIRIMGDWFRRRNAEEVRKTEQADGGYEAACRAFGNEGGNTVWRGVDQMNNLDLVGHTVAHVRTTCLGAIDISADDTAKVQRGYRERHWQAVPDDYVIQEGDCIIFVPGGNVTT